MSGIHLFVGFNENRYIPGRNITGVIVLVIQKDIKAKSLKLKWRGIEVAYWTLGIRQNQSKFKTNTIFEHNTDIWEYDDGSVLEKGTYTYDFVWKLPENLPLSLESGTESEWVIPNDSIIPKFVGNDKFYIKYSATAILTFENLNDPVENFLLQERFFNVLETIKPEYLNAPPIVVKESKTFLFGQDMPLNLKMTVENGGFIFRGQKLIVNLDINNASKRNVEGIRFLLTCITCLRSENVEETFVREEAILKSMIHGIQISPNTSFKKDVSLEIPSSAHGSILNGKIVSRKYELSCNLVVAMGIDLNAKVEINLLEMYDLKSENDDGLIIEVDEDDDVFTLDDDDDDIDIL